ncbi:hypothetical protein C8Q80DRAFT_774585 [Daedaleopsis nitida]|nr:hypothetical protein C8Q80DRAFT_774585 [Daedaleopsis nitida]
MCLRACENESFVEQMPTCSPCRSYAGILRAHKDGRTHRTTRSVRPYALRTLLGHMLYSSIRTLLTRRISIAPSRCLSRLRPKPPMLPIAICNRCPPLTPEPFGKVEEYMLPIFQVATCAAPPGHGLSRTSVDSGEPLQKHASRVYLHQTGPRRCAFAYYDASLAAATCLFMMKMDTQCRQHGPARRCYPIQCHGRTLCTVAGTVCDCPNWIRTYGAHHGDWVSDNVEARQTRPLWNSDHEQAFSFAKKHLWPPLRSELEDTLSATPSHPLQAMMSPGPSPLVCKCCEHLSTHLAPRASALDYSPASDVRFKVQTQRRPRSDVRSAAARRV